MKQEIHSVRTWNLVLLVALTIAVCLVIGLGRSI